MSQDRWRLLVADLNWVVDHLLRNAYKQAGDLDEREHPTLAGVVRGSVGEEQWRARPNLSLIETVGAAINGLPERFSERPSKGTVKRTRVPGDCTDSPEREIAEIIFGFRDDELAARFGKDKERFTYKKDYHPAARQRAGLDERPLKTTQRMILVIREDLADKLLEMERKAIERRERAEAAQEETSPSDGKQVLIARHEYIELLQRHRDAGHLVICIWGEAGTGKTTLAEQFARRLAGSAPTLIIRTASMVTGLTADAEMYRRDLIEAFITEGLNPAVWQPDTYLARLCERIGGQPRSGAVVIDNVSDDDLIERLVRSQPKIPVIITMRDEPSIAGIASEHLHDFTGDQAREFISRQLSGQDERDVLALAHFLGNRPLALEHAVLFVKSSDITLKSLLDSLAIDIADTLATVTPPERQERNIIELYKLILASLIEDESAKSVLDNFLAIAGATGIELREILYTFMQSEQGGSHDRLHFLAGINMLKRRGLIHEQQRIIRASSQRVRGRQRHLPQLSMHTLTYQILRALRGMVPLEIETAYLNFLRGLDYPASDDEDLVTSFEFLHMLLRSRSMRAIESFLPRGWKALDIIDHATFIALIEPPESDDSSGSYVVRYVNRPNREVHKLDYRTGTWSILDANEEEGRRLWYAIVMYQEIIMPELLRLEEMRFDSEGEELPPENPEVAAGRLDLAATPSDGLGHRILDPGRPGFFVKHGQEVWSLCGKRYVPTSASPSASCPECSRLTGSAERLKEVEKTLLEYLRQLDYEDPLKSAHLFLVRARVRRELGNSVEAAHDVVLAYDFLIRAVHVSEGDRLSIGEGIVTEAMALPNMSKNRALIFVDYLMTMTQKTNPEGAYLLYVRSQLLEKLDRSAEALAGYEQIVSSADAGEIDKSVVEMSRVFYNKETLERKLGRSRDANASLRRAIGEAEKRSDGGKALVALLHLSGVYLAQGDTRSEHEQARRDLQRAIDITRSQETPNYDTLWMCLRRLVDVYLILDNRTGALETAEGALKVVDDHLSDRSDLRDQTMRVIASIEENGPNEES